MRGGGGCEVLVDFFLSLWGVGVQGAWCVMGLHGRGLRVVFRDVLYGGPTGRRVFCDFLDVT